MTKETQTTEVVFRIDTTKDFKGTIYALFPYEISHQYYVSCYLQIGGQTGADYKYCIRQSKPATKEQYQELYNELENIGYNLKVIKQQNYDKYLKAYYESKKQ